MTRRILLRLFAGFGLGDIVAFSVVLKHLSKYRPDWEVDVQSAKGYHDALHGLCRRSLCEDPPSGGYDSCVDVSWQENRNRFADRPSTKATSCLAQIFDVPYDSLLGRYELQVPQSSRVIAAIWLSKAGCREGASFRTKFNSVVLHYMGTSHRAMKELEHWEALAVIEQIKKMGCVPVVLDFENRCPLVTAGLAQSPLQDMMDPRVVAALIDQSQLFIGIDSGPSKIASATDTPALVCWRGHSPATYHDPAPNTLHLVPDNWRAVTPCDDTGVAGYFEKNYLFAEYAPGAAGLVAKLRELVGGCGLSA